MFGYVCHLQNGVADVQEMGYNELITHKANFWWMLVIFEWCPNIPKSQDGFLVKCDS